MYLFERQKCKVFLLEEGRYGKANAFGAKLQTIQKQYLSFRGTMFAPSQVDFFF